ncbi:MAG: TIM barrel protein [Verrucomicrobiaceae bacterium]|nr:TIM barrel protein [Verrucomicrobiaceae bacterium]
MNTRRAFVRNLSALAFTAPLLAETPKKGKNTICYFTKHLQGLSFDEIASVSAEMGVDGIEAPIRPKGHIEPEKVVDELPKFIDALKKQGLEMTIMTSGINEVSAEQRTEEVLRTAAKLGVKRFRMNYFKYDLKQPIWDQLQAVRPKIKDLVALCKEIGIQPLFQNHSGKDYFGAPVWDIYSIMREYPAADFSFCFDILHATCEGGKSWPLEFNLVRDHLGAAYFKDYKWEGRKMVTCPLGEGQVEPEYAKMLMKTGYSGPISLHVEYLEGNAKDPAVLKTFREAHARDIATLRSWLAA